MNNLDPDVAERPADLVVYGGAGKASRDWPSLHAIVRELQNLGDDETLLVSSAFMRRRCKRAVADHIPHALARK